MKVFLSDIRRGMEWFGSCVGALVNTMLLSIVYFFGVGVTSFIAKAAGKRFLDMEIRKDAPSYWSDLRLKKKSLEEYYRQF